MKRGWTTLSSQAFKVEENKVLQCPLDQNPDEEKERRKGMDNERDSGSNPKTHGPRERKEADKANGMDRKFSCIKMLKHRTK